MSEATTPLCWRCYTCEGFVPIGSHCPRCTPPPRRKFETPPANGPYAGPATVRVLETGMCGLEVIERRNEYMRRAGSNGARARRKGKA